jgi:predicted Zn finger-like uncharacterized protein
MQFSTQCPHCSTAFLITADQIRVASGLVRCGVCASIFEADRHLFEVEDGDEGLAVQAARPPGPGSSVGNGAQSSIRLNDSGPEDSVIDEADAPSFTRRGARTEQSSPRGWGKWTAVLSLALVVQLIGVNRNHLYAAAPELMSHVESVCHCDLGWPRQLQSLVVDESSFQITPSSIHELHIKFRNQSRWMVKTPDLLVTLIDASERPVVQKHFSHQQVDLPSQLSGGQSLAVDLKFQVPARLAEQIVGFRSEFFYP